MIEGTQGHRLFAVISTSSSADLETRTRAIVINWMQASQGRRESADTVDFPIQAAYIVINLFNRGRILLDSGAVLLNIRSVLLNSSSICIDAIR